MKKSLILSFTFGVCVSMNAYGTIQKCPKIQNQSDIRENIGSWRLLLSNQFSKKNPGKNWKFYSAWIFNERNGKYNPAECHYKDSAGVKIKYINESITGKSFKFKNQGRSYIKYQDRYKGYHCDQANTHNRVECEFVPK